MPTKEQIKEILGKIRDLTLSKKSKEDHSRPSPLPPMSPFTHVRDIVRERDADNKQVELVSVFRNYTVASEWGRK